MRSWLPSLGSPAVQRRWMTRCVRAVPHADGKLSSSRFLPFGDGRVFFLLALAQARPPVNRCVGAGWRQIRYGRSLVCPILDGGSPLLSFRCLSARTQRRVSHIGSVDNFIASSSPYLLSEYNIQVQTTCRRFNYLSVLNFYAFF